MVTESFQALHGNKEPFLGSEQAIAPTDGSQEEYRHRATTDSGLPSVGTHWGRL